MKMKRNAAFSVLALVLMAVLCLGLFRMQAFAADSIITGTFPLNDETMSWDFEFNPASFQMFTPTPTRPR